MKRTNPSFIYCVVMVILIYLGLAQAIFEYRNPLANRMSFFRDFGSVVTFDKLEQYQPR